MIDLNRSLWLHGWGTSPAVWQPMLGQLPPAPDFSAVRTPAGLVAAVVEQGCRDRVETLVGWSLGGMLALAAAPQLPELKRCILIGTAPSFVRRDDLDGWPPGILKRMQRAFQADPEAVRREFLARHLPDCEIATCSETLAARDAGLEFLATAELRPTAADLTVPILWLHGARDGLFRTPAPPLVQSWLPLADLTFRICANSGHAPFIDEPRLCSQAVSTFIDTP